jgi:DNA-binding beta-propeller fold protein YncE
VISVVTMTCKDVIAQTHESITEKLKAFENNPQIMIGGSLQKLQSMAINKITNKIYVANSESGTVYVIESDSGSAVKTHLAILRLIQTTIKFT